MQPAQKQYIANDTSYLVYPIPSTSILMQFGVHVLFVENGDKMGKLLLKPRGKQLNLPLILYHSR